MAALDVERAPPIRYTPVYSYNIVQEPVAFHVARQKPKNSDNSPICDVLDTYRPMPRPQYWFLDPRELGPLQWEKGTPVGQGLNNFANICFLNATVQALCYCPGFAQGCLKKKHTLRCGRGTGLCAFCEIEKHVRVLFGSQHKSGVVSWPPLLLQLMRKQIHLNGSRGRFEGLSWLGLQNCAHEWLTQFLDLLTKLDLPPEMETAFEAGRLRHSELQTCYVHQLFSAEYEDAKVCAVCNSETKQFELSTCLRLPVANSLEKALEKSFSSELLTEQNKPMCDRCGVPQPKNARRLIARPPNILTVLLQRTEYSSKPLVLPRFQFAGGNIFKNARHTDVSMTLSLEDYLSEEGKQLFSKGDSCYDFHSAVCHVGSVGFGHYWAVVKGPDSNFYEIDDETVKQISINEAKKQLGSAYLLFYGRRSSVDFMALLPQSVDAGGAPRLSLFKAQEKEALMASKASLEKRVPSLQIKLSLGWVEKAQTPSPVSGSSRKSFDNKICDNGVELSDSTTISNESDDDDDGVSMSTESFDDDRQLTKQMFAEATCYSEPTPVPPLHPYSLDWALPNLRSYLKSQPRYQSRRLRTACRLARVWYRPEKHLPPLVQAVRRRRLSQKKGLPEGSSVSLSSSPSEGSSSSSEKSDDADLPQASKRVDPSERLKRLQSAHSQFAGADVSRWDTSESKFDSGAFVELQKQLMAHSEKRSDYDVDYDKGKLKKIRKRKADTIGSLFETFANRQQDRKKS